MSLHSTVIVTIWCHTETGYPCNHGLSRRCDRSHHLTWDLTCALSPILEQHILWQIWHWKLLVVGGPDFRRSHLASNSRIRRDSNSCTADLHVDCSNSNSNSNHSNTNNMMSYRNCQCFNRKWLVRLWCFGSGLINLFIKVAVCCLCQWHHSAWSLRTVSAFAMLMHTCCIHCRGLLSKYSLLD